jgi:Transposase domain (DUF772)
MWAVGTEDTAGDTKWPRPHRHYDIYGSCWRFRDPDRSLDNFDFHFNEEINRALIYELAHTLRRATRDDALFLGPRGTGKEPSCTGDRPCHSAGPSHSLIAYFEGIDSERGIAWRAADSLALRDFLGVALEDALADHSTISRTRRLIALEAHRAVFTWVLQCLSPAGLVKRKTIGVDVTTLEANAALRSIVQRESGESYKEFLTTLAKASG